MNDDIIILCVQYRAEILKGRNYVLIQKVQIFVWVDRKFLLQRYSFVVVLMAAQIGDECK